MGVDLYDVRTSHPHTSVDTFIPFLGELRDNHYFRPSDSAKEMMDKVADMVSEAFNSIPGSSIGVLAEDA